MGKQEYYKCIGVCSESEFRKHTCNSAGSSWWQLTEIAVKGELLVVTLIVSLASLGATVVCSCAVLEKFCAHYWQQSKCIMHPRATVMAKSVYVFKCCRCSVIATVAEMAKGQEKCKQRQTVKGTHAQNFI